MRIPFDVLTRIASELGNNEEKKIDDPDSSIYWALSAHQLAAYRSDRTSPLEAFTQVHLKSLLAVSHEFREAASHQLRSPLVIQGAGDIRRILDQKTSTLGRLGSAIEVEINQDLWTDVFALFKLHTDCLSSLTLDVGQEARFLDATVLYETLSQLPHMTTFTYRASLTGVWINQRALLNLLGSWPHLRHLTVFQLCGGLTAEPNITLHPANTVRYRLRSLHLRRFSRVSGEDLRAILVDSFESLQELTIVFDRTPHHTQSQSAHRGLNPSALHSVVNDCRAIQKLRVGDLVARIQEYNFAGHDVPYDPPEGPLGFVVDDLVRSLPDLRVLEISGRIFSMDLFENLRTAGAFLQQLTILRYPSFPSANFIKQLSTNPALEKLSVLRMGCELEVEEAHKFHIGLVCGQRKISLEWLRVSAEEIEDGVDMHFVEWSDDEEDGATDALEDLSIEDQEDEFIDGDDQMNNAEVVVH